MDRWLSNWARRSTIILFAKEKIFIASAGKPGKDTDTSISRHIGIPLVFTFIFSRRLASEPFHTQMVRPTSAMKTSPWLRDLASKAT